YNELLCRDDTTPESIFRVSLPLQKGLMSKRRCIEMAKYENMLVTNAALDEEASAALVGKFKSLIEANGTIDSVDEWGKKRLAYPINDQTEGVYTVIKFTSNPDFPAELDRVYKITEGVLRSIIIAEEE